MKIRSYIKKRNEFLKETGAKAATAGNQQTALDCLIRMNELELMRKEMKI